MRNASFVVFAIGIVNIISRNCQVFLRPVRGPESGRLRADLGDYTPPLGSGRSRMLAEVPPHRLVGVETQDLRVFDVRDAAELARLVDFASRRLAAIRVW